MAKTLEELRADLARAAGMFHTGMATGGSTVKLIEDTNGLTHFTEDQALKGALAYIREDAGGAGAAPEGEARWVDNHTAASKTVGVEYNFSAAVATGDTYEIYRAPLTLEQWNQCINLAIRETWPEVWERAVLEMPSTGGINYALGSTVEDVLEVHVRMVGELEGLPGEPVPRGLWRVEGTPGTDLYLWLDRPIPSEGRDVRVFYKRRYAELSQDESTDLDYAYIMAAARANLHEMLAGETGGQADAGDNLRLMNHWRQEAAQRKQMLAAALVGMPVQQPAAKRRRR